MKDLTQQVFVQLFAKSGHVLRQWDPSRGLSLMNYVGLVAEREVAATLRSRKKSPWRTEELMTPEDMEQSPTSGDNPEDRYTSCETFKKLLAEARKRLSVQGQEFFQWMIVERRSVAEVCHASGKSADSVYAWRSRIGRFVADFHDRLLAEQTRPR